MKAMKTNTQNQLAVPIPSFSPSGLSSRCDTDSISSDPSNPPLIRGSGLPSCGLRFGLVGQRGRIRPLRLLWLLWLGWRLSRLRLRRVFHPRHVCVILTHRLRPPTGCDPVRRECRTWTDSSLSLPFPLGHLISARSAWPRPVEPGTHAVCRARRQSMRWKPRHPPPCPRARGRRQWPLERRWLR